METKFKPTRSELRRVRDLARWCEEAIGSGWTINGEPSSQVWSGCAFGLAADVAKRAGGAA